MYDLTSVQDVERYLSETPFAASSVIPLSGGNVNFTYRVVLQKPYGTDEVHSMVLKHAGPYLATIKTFLFAEERQDFESKALKYVAGLTPSSAIASVPKLYHEDRKHRVLLMSDCGETSTTLKALFQTAPPTAEVSHIMGSSLGVFLARLHCATLGHGSDAEIKTFFQANQQARTICAYITYGRLISTIAPETTDPTLIVPPLDLSPAQLITLATLAEKMQDRIVTNNDVLAMGDFWPGNILVSSTPVLQANVVDWEATRPGPAGLEIGQFLAEMHSLRTFHPLSTTSVDSAISSFLASYRETVMRANFDEQMLSDVAWDAVTHFGVHLVTWTPRVPWGGKEHTREVVLEGLEYLLHVPQRDEGWLRTSIVQGLLL